MAKKSKKREIAVETKNWISKIAGILAGCALIIFASCLLLAIAGYNPEDESFNVSNSDKISNFMGKFGSYSADFIVNSYGMAVLIFLIPLFVWGFLLIKHQKIIEFKIRLLAVLLGIISLAGFLWQIAAVPLEKINMAGKFSHVLPRFLMDVFKGWKMEGYENIVSLVLLGIIALMSFNLAIGITFRNWEKMLKIGKNSFKNCLF